MSRRLPDLFLHVGGTHVHHLNYGIFLLSGVGAWSLLSPPRGRHLRWALAAFGVGLALTFDEFGIWLHLGGSYWQRASFDAVVVVGSALALIALAPTLKRLRPRHWFTVALLAFAVVAFTLLLVDSFNYAGSRIGPELRNLEEYGPK